MPLVRIEIYEGRSPEEVQQLADTVHEAAVTAFAAPPADRFQIIQQHPREQMIMLDFGLGFWGYGVNDSCWNDNGVTHCERFGHNAGTLNVDYLWQSNLVRGQAQLDWHIGAGGRAVWFGGCNGDCFDLAARMPIAAVRSSGPKGPNTLKERVLLMSVRKTATTKTRSTSIGRRCRDFQVDVSGNTVFGRRYGNGPPILLVHGFPRTSLMWRDVAPQLATDHTVIAVDLRAYGHSGTPSRRRTTSRTPAGIASPSLCRWSWPSSATRRSR
jgi:phenylpyruvate tautomerase PptA (4-oxalocrotonate tautomerase family)